MLKFTFDEIKQWAYVSDLLKLSNVERTGKNLKEEHVRKERIVFKAIPRLLDMIEPTDRAKTYIAKLADSLEKEGYTTDASIVRESIKIMNGEKVPLATMDEKTVSEKDKLTDLSDGKQHLGWLDDANALEESVNEDLMEAGREWIKPQLDKSYEPYGESKMMELTKFDGYAMLDAIEFGANWMLNKIRREYEKNRG